MTEIPKIANNISACINNLQPQTINTVESKINFISYLLYTDGIDRITQNPGVSILYCTDIIRIIKTHKLNVPYLVLAYCTS